jgi:hypothetical protein
MAGLKKSILGFVRSLIGVDHINARFDVLEKRLEKMGYEYKEAVERQIQLEAGLAERRHCLEAWQRDTVQSTANFHKENQTIASHQAEIDTCRQLAPRAVFVMGVARSSTTIVTQIINTSRQAMILGEANFYIGKTGCARFSDWYNAQHELFDNQISKTSYAPDFIPLKDHLWWEWLAEASQYYHLIGDKMAFSAQHFNLVAPYKVRRFFEARFFEARYIFTLRDPIQTLLSAAHLFRIADDKRMLPEIQALLRFVQMWADWIRTFPNTITLLVDDLQPETISQIGDFLDLELSGAEILLNGEEKRKHNIDPGSFPLLLRIVDDLASIYGDIRESLTADPLFWHADQKRTLSGNDTRGNPKAATRQAPYPLGQVWARAEALLKMLDDEYVLVQNRST